MALAVTAHVTDDVEGVETVEARLSAWDASDWRALELTSGTALDGTWTADDLDTSTTAEGEYTLHVRATDEAGNGADTEPGDPNPVAVAAVTIDHTAPDVDITGVTEDEVYYEPVSVEVTVTDANEDPDATEITLDDDPFDPETDEIASGDHTLRVQAVDLAGNETVEEVSFRVHLIEHSVSIELAFPRVLLAHGGSFPGFIAGALDDGGIFHDEVSSGNDVGPTLRNGLSNVLVLHLASGFGWASDSSMWPEIAVQVGGGSCESYALGVVVLDVANISNTYPVSQRLGAYVMSSSWAPDDMHFVDSALLSEQDVYFTGVEGKFYLDPYHPSDAAATVGSPPSEEVVALLGDASAERGYKAGLSIDPETDPVSALAEVIRNAVAYTVPEELEQPASRGVVPVKVTIVNDAPFTAYVKLEETLPSGATLAGSVEEPSEASPPTWEVEVGPESTRDVVYLARLAEGTGSYTAESTLSVREDPEDPYTELNVREAELEVDETIATAHAAVEAELSALMSDPDISAGDVMTVYSVWTKVNETETMDDETAGAADDIIDKLRLGFQDLGYVTSVDIADACRELARLMRYWSWEWSAR